MLDFAIVLLFLAALTYVGLRAFTRPEGVYWRSAAGVGATALAAALVWQLISPGAEAGLGAFVLWVGVVALAALMALVACAAATARHILEALRAR